MKNIHISGPLTNVVNRSQLLQVYESLVALAHRYAETVYSPVKDNAFTHTDNRTEAYHLWKKGYIDVSASYCVIAYVGQPSLGVGAELEIARVTASKIIVWYYKNDVVSKMALGTPAISAQIKAEDDNDLMQKLETYLKTYGE